VDLDATVRDLAPRLLGYCRLVTGDQSLAEEVCQDTLAALVQRWRRQGPPDSPVAFAFAIARRRCTRSAVRRRLLLPLERVLGRDNGRPSPEQEMLLAARRHGLLRSLARLSGKDRQVLLLLSVGGL
jgi:DNA-directed RNA polymerase specialized sigma24 family protein